MTDREDNIAAIFHLADSAGYDRAYHDYAGEKHDLDQQLRIAIALERIADGLAALTLIEIRKSEELQHAWEVW